MCEGRRRPCPAVKREEPWREDSPLGDLDEAHHSGLRLLEGEMERMMKPFLPRSLRCWGPVAKGKINILGKHPRPPMSVGLRGTRTERRPGAGPNGAPSPGPGSRRAGQVAAEGQGRVWGRPRLRCLVSPGAPTGLPMNLTSGPSGTVQAPEAHTLFPPAWAGPVPPHCSRSA